MDTRQLEYILAIAEEKNLSRAAERLFLSQSALSQHLAKLKAEGLPPLFYRHKGEMRLTDAGKIYINGARIILKIWEDTGRLLRDGSENRDRRLRLAVSRNLQPLIYTRLLPQLKKSHPEIHITVSALAALTARKTLEQDEADLTVFQAARSFNEVIDYTVLREDELVIATPPGREEAHLPLLLPPPQTHLRLICDHALRSFSSSYRVYAELDDTPTALNLVEQGECAAAIPLSQLKGSGLPHRLFPTPGTFYTVAACRYGYRTPLLEETIKQLQLIFQSV